MAAIVHKADDPEQFRKFIGPGHCDQMVRAAIQACWMMLPNKRKTLQALEEEFQRLVDRAFRDMKEDEKSFGTSKS